MKQNIPSLASVVEQAENQSELRRIKDYVVLLNSLTRNVRPTLPAHLREETRVIYTDKYQLTLESATLRHQMELVLLIPAVLKKMRTKLPELKKIDVIITPKKSELLSPARPFRLLSRESSSMIQHVAAIAPSGLRQALDRLASCNEKIRHEND